jgi:predicted nucleic acid-binding protein
VTRFFLDTNVLAYADDGDQPGKQAIALDLLSRGFSDPSGVVSLQVLQEYYVTATRKLGVARGDARRKVELFARLEMVRLEAPDILAAIDLQALHSFSFWDALIIQAALLARCTILYSEDLQPGFRLGAMRIVNPFMTSFQGGGA